MTKVLPFKAGAFSSVHAGQNQLFAGGEWASSSRQTATAVGVFSVPVMLQVIELAFAGSDITADRSRISVDAQDVDGGYSNLFTLNNCGIQRGAPGTMSQDHSKAYGVNPGYALSRVHISSLMLVVHPRKPVIAVKLEISGHGWHAARDLKAMGVLAHSNPEPWPWGAAMLQKWYPELRETVSYED